MTSIASTVRVIALSAASLSLCAACAAHRVEGYLTTADRSKLLARGPDISSSTQPARPGVPTPTIEVDPAHAYQGMVGFGAALTDASAWLIQHKLTTAQRDSLLRDLFVPDPGVGFSFVRIDMGASDFSLRHYSYDDVRAGESDPTLAHFSIAPDTAETIPILKRALEINPRLEIVGSPWSAPGWMKTTGSMIKGRLRPDAYAAYAEYFRRFVEAYAAAGIPIYAITIQNEPHFEPADYPGMRMEPAARTEFIGRHLGPLFTRAGIRTRILDWDHNWDEPRSPLTVLADSTARRYVAGVAWHCYAGDVSAQGPVHDAYPDKDAYLTECSGGDWAPKWADNFAWTVKNLVIGATRNWARGVSMWNLALDENHGPHTGGCGNCRGVVTIDSRTGAVTRNEEYYALAHASRFVKPGARRIESSMIARLDNVAFHNADGSSVLIVLNSDTTTRTFAVRDRDRTFDYTLPAGAVVTFRWR
ncbi:MAG TPA: glycoside hydrolase family 30 beta sandwich domain-containing protein [Gemmatimonadaceae bacterium]|nr:glycoside hydrolase family 30 beta sandwich domain-containing protein [Gemmatimonadaceae bacterium]